MLGVESAVVHLGFCVLVLAIDILSAFVTADCGIMHLASATSTPVVGMFSVTDIETYRPYNHGSTALKVTSATTPEDISSLLRNILAEERSPARTDKTKTPKVNKLQASWRKRNTLHEHPIRR